LNCNQRLCAFALSGLLLQALSGCQPKNSVVASVNGVNISQDEYVEHVQTVDYPTLSQVPAQLDAGGLTLVSMIQQELTHQLASKDKKTAVSDEQVEEYINSKIRNEPDTARQLELGRLSRENLARQVRFTYEQFSIGTDGAKPSDAEVQKAYDEQKDNRLKYKTLYTVRMIPVTSIEKGNEVLQELKKSGDFRKAGEANGYPPLELIYLNKNDFVTADQYPELSTVLDTLKPNEFTPSPVTVMVTNRQNPTGPKLPAYVIGQLIKKDPERIPTLKEVRVLLEHQLVEQTHPEADRRQHFASLLTDFTSKSQVQIYLKRYEPLSIIFTKQATKAAADLSPNHPPIQ
jgi:hypothetical protein